MAASNDFRDELVQVAAVAVAILTDLEQGNTRMSSGGLATAAHEIAMGRVERERAQQELKWGMQHHAPFTWLAILGEEVGEACQAALEAHTFTAAD